MLRKRWRWAVFALLWAVAPPLRADDEYDKLVEQYTAAMQKWNEQVREAGNSGQRPPSPTREFVPKFRAYAAKHARQAEAIPALTWLLEKQRPTGEGREMPQDARWALDQLMKQAADPAIKHSLQPLRAAAGRWGAEPLLPLFDKIEKTNPDRDVKAAALFSRGYVLVNAGGSAKDGEADAKKAAEVFRTVVRKYPNTTAASQAEPFIFEAEHLQIGMKAPDFTGEDANGKPVKLSDFKGRVVVVDFWGEW